MSDGSFGAERRRQRHELRERRDRRIAHLRAWPGDLRRSLPQGGLAVWVELPEGVDTLQAYPEALDRGVVITPGPLFSVSGQFRNCMRPSYSHPWDKRRVDALNLLSAVLMPQG